MKVLSVDVGNTTAHLCEFTGGTAMDLGRVRHDDLESFEGDYDLVGAVCVRESFKDTLRDIFGDRLRIIEKRDIPIEVDYGTPETLGTDRVLNAYSVMLKGVESAVIVSVGTAIVVDLLLEGVFKGGFITAGPRLKGNCLGTRAEGIPILEPGRTEVLVGRSTQECVRGGIYLESYFYIKNTAKRWVENFKKELPIVITGGDGWMFEELGEYDPLLIHRGIYSIIING